MYQTGFELREWLQGGLADRKDYLNSIIKSFGFVESGLNYPLLILGGSYNGQYTRFSFS